MSGQGRRALLGSVLGGLAGSLLGVGVFHLVFGNRTNAAVLAALLLVCGLVLGFVALWQARRR